MLTEFKPKFSQIINLIAKPFIKINPNILTLIGLISPIFFFLFLYNKYYFLALIMLGGILFDTIDGAVARMTNNTTAFGGFWDSSIDRVADFLFISSFGFSGIVRWEIVVVVLFLSFLISYIRSRAELAAKGDLVLAVGIIERPERMIFILLALISCWFFQGVNMTFINFEFNLTEIVFIILGVFSTITIFQRFFAAYKLLK